MAGTIVANTLNTDTGVFSTNNAYTGIAKAWVQFVGSSGSINGSFNVSSVTRTGTGVYTVNFATAMTNSNYAVAATSSAAVGTADVSVEIFNSTAPTTSSFYIKTLNTYSGSTYDANYICATVFGA